MPAREDPSLPAWIHLALTPGVPRSAQREWLRAFGSPDAVVSASASQLSAVSGNAPARALREANPEAPVAQVLAWLSQDGNRLLALGEPDYPPLLLRTEDPPTLLFLTGDAKVLRRPGLAIVGSRQATTQGLEDARAFAAAFSRAGHAIISGLALGIDGAAHRGGLEGDGGTIAVVGTGLDRVYPKEHHALARQIASRGALVSEFPLGTPPLAENFPRRNRIISGLARGVLVVEAALRSGSLTTARLALEQGRDVFAIPGSIHSPLAKGCHRLIKEGAKLVESADDILSEWEGRPVLDQFDPLPAEESGTLLTALGHSPATLDALVARTGREAGDLAAELTQLELDRRVERLAGGLYRRLDVSR